MSVHTPSKYTSLSALRAIQADNNIAQSGKEYSDEELTSLVQQKETALAERVVIDWIESPDTFGTREEWLTQAVSFFRESLFKRLGFVVPEVRVSVGLPGGRNGKKAIGQHWSPEASDDLRSQIFISPTIDDGVLVLAVLVHELVHAVVGNKAGHGPVFKSCAVKVGLEGKMTSTTAGAKLTEILQAFIGKTGPYPHAKLNPGMGPTKKQGTRMIKQECQACEYIVRSSRTCIETHGPVICPGCSERMSVAGAE
jgi:hypothetical protein